MARTALAPLTQWITEAAVAHASEALPDVVAQRLGITRRKALHLLRRLAEAQWLTDAGTARKPRFVAGPLRQVVRRYALAGLQEDLPWRRDFAPCFALPAEVNGMARHAFGELLNNAIEHSGGTQVTVSMRQTALQLQLLVSDDGCGVFRRIDETFAIGDPQLAMLELSKGKLTSAPQRHCGRGLYFTSRLADVFDLHANAHAFQRRAWERQPWRAGRPAVRTGSSIYLAIALDTPRTLDAVMRAHSLDMQGYGFERTVVPLHLLATGGVLDSRAEARRVSARLADFARAELDFSGITDIGHGFADELFRVFKAEQPQLALVPLHAGERVQRMLGSIAAA